MGLVEQGKGPKHAVIGKSASAEYQTTGTHEAVGTDSDGLAVLAVVLQVDGMAEQLGVVAGDNGEWADADAVGAVDVVMLGDGGMGTQNQLSTSLGLVGEVGGAGADGKAGDPIAPANGGVLAHIDGFEVQGHGESIDAGASCHAQAAGIDPGQADAGGWIKLEAIEALQQAPLELPGQNHDDALDAQLYQPSEPHAWKAKRR